MSGRRSIEVKSAGELLEFELSSAATLSSGKYRSFYGLHENQEALRNPWKSPTFVVFCIRPR
ncbi:hypothetical protein KIN20_004640 [Parelaphostrongylus tenuis]|uniref:Uncharacterized protein n=1 Tax=Parelaphostrongylus tenuis TaxID=148309 RepID=A0AAD5MK33_PARTN|nr:hypothetical protein KIN20_004640 [Parelaphostrongylus tenuis]